MRRARPRSCGPTTKRRGTALAHPARAVARAARRARLKINHDVVVPRGRVPQLFDLVTALGRELDLTIPCFGHAGDGNIHVNIMIDPDDPDAVRARAWPSGASSSGVVALEGSISGEHGIGFAKAPFVGIELSPDVIALMKRVKAAFDPKGILNPGKMFPPEV